MLEKRTRARAVTSGKTQPFADLGEGKAATTKKPIMQGRKWAVKRGSYGHEKRSFEGAKTTLS